VRSFIIRTPHRKLWEVRTAFKNLKGKANLGDLTVDVIKTDLKRYMFYVTLTGFIWLRIGFNARSSEHGNGSPVSHKSWVTISFSGMTLMYRVN
jgi:hypothetical protein